MGRGGQHAFPGAGAGAHEPGPGRVRVLQPPAGDCAQWGCAPLAGDAAVAAGTGIWRRCGRWPGHRPLGHRHPLPRDHPGLAGDEAAGAPGPEGLGLLRFLPWHRGHGDARRLLRAAVHAPQAAAAAARGPAGLPLLQRGRVDGRPAVHPRVPAAVVADPTLRDLHADLSGGVPRLPHLREVRLEVRLLRRHLPPRPAGQCLPGQRHLQPTPAAVQHMAGDVHLSGVGNAGDL
mmetsp:Transcript_149363/g.416309  ORF Transcript_149363/g.416309 Transcript_149363/m.416309 type:complete len:233 (+) Transcript_149363:286-984(+)